MNFPPPDPKVCQLDAFVPLYARVTVYAVVGLLNLLYIYVAVRIGFKAKSNLLLYLIALLLVMNTSAAMVQFYYDLHLKDQCGIVSEQQYRRNTIASALATFSTTVCYMSAQQVFAYTYWTLSYKVESIYKKEASSDLKF